MITLTHEHHEHEARRGFVVYNLATMRVVQYEYSQLAAIRTRDLLDAHAQTYGKETRYAYAPMADCNITDVYL